MAEVVGAPLHDLHVELAPESAFDDRNVLVDHLLLEILGAGRDHGLQARAESRDQVGEGLADAGAGLRHELVAGRYGGTDLGRQVDLLGARLVRLEGRGERAAGRKERGDHYSLYSSAGPSYGGSSSRVGAGVAPGSAAAVPRSTGTGTKVTTKTARASHATAR